MVGRSPPRHSTQQQAAWCDRNAWARRRWQAQQADQWLHSSDHGITILIAAQTHAAWHRAQAWAGTCLVTTYEAARGGQAGGSGRGSRSSSTGRPLPRRILGGLARGFALWGCPGFEPLCDSGFGSGGCLSAVSPRLKSTDRWVTVRGEMLRQARKTVMPLAGLCHGQRWGCKCPR